jgi:hypothetical protein
MSEPDTAMPFCIIARASERIPAPAMPIRCA